MPMLSTGRTSASRNRELTRREFLQRGSTLALGTAIASQIGWVVGCGHVTARSAGPSHSAWDDLRKKIKGTLLRPGDPNYDNTGLATNLAYADVRPQGIVLTAGAADVQTCVKWARNHGLPAVPRSGGHSYAGYSTTEGLLVDLSPLKKVLIDQTSNIATIGAGALLGPVDELVTAQNFIVPSGRCKPVGIGGLVLGGGLGFNARKFGLTSDNLLKTRIVTADGELRECSASDNGDLFWALRGGGGGNFGINVDFEIQAYKVENASVYKLTWPLADRDAAVAAWEAVQNAARQAPDEFSLILAAEVENHHGTPVSGLTAIGQYLGPVSELEELLIPVIRAARPETRTIKGATISEATEFLAQEGAPDAYLTKSAFIEDRLPTEAVIKIIDWIGRFPKESRAADFAIFGWGGAINDVPVKDTAFVHRSAAFTVEADSSWHPEDDQSVIDASKAWIQSMFADLARYFTGYAYQNFIDRSQSNWQNAYYGENFAKLVSVKADVDPNDFFSFEQSIPTRSA